MSSAALRAVPLDAFVAVYHRPSGITHLLTSPAPEILAALAERALTADGLLASLTNDYELEDAASLIARLDELVAAGLVERLTVSPA